MAMGEASRSREDNEDKSFHTSQTHGCYSKCVKLVFEMSSSHASSTTALHVFLHLRLDAPPAQHRRRVSLSLIDSDIFPMSPRACPSPFDSSILAQLMQAAPSPFCTTGDAKSGSCGDRRRVRASPDICKHKLHACKIKSPRAVKVAPHATRRDMRGNPQRHVSHVLYHAARVGRSWAPGLRPTGAIQSAAEMEAKLEYISCSLHCCLAAQYRPISGGGVGWPWGGRYC